MRVAHAVLGAAVGAAWLVLPAVTEAVDAPAPVTGAGPVASATTNAQDETSPVDLILPVATLGVVGVLAAYAYVRRTRRARIRTTPGGAPAGPPAHGPAALRELDERTRRLLVQADDCVRASREELAFAEARSGTAAVEPFARALREAEGELAAAFGMRQRYDEGVPAEESARRQALAGIVGRCQEAGRRLDAAAAGFDAMRGLEQGEGVREALALAEARFRELTARTGSAEGVLAELAERYGPSASTPVTGYAEQAKDRLVFATARLNDAHQSADAADHLRAAARLRTAESAIAQTATFVHAIERLATELSEATELIPAALTGAEVEVAGARERLAWAVEVAAAGASGVVLEGGGSAGAGVAGSAEETVGGGAGVAGAAEKTTAGGAGVAGAAEAPVGGDGGVPGAADETLGGDGGVPGTAREAVEGSRGLRGPAPVAGADQGTARGAAGMTGPAPGAVEGSRSMPGPAAVAGAVDVPLGELRARVVHADFALGSVREEVVGGVYDPLDVLRRIVRAVEPLATGRAAVVPVAGVLVARSAVAAASDYVTTHRGAVGATARTRLAEAQRLLGTEPVEASTADALARQARELAEQDVRLHGTPVVGPAEHASGIGGAVLGGILLTGTPTDGGPAASGSLAPPSYGGPDTRTRRGTPPPH
ncbi:hypothetical protein [Streptomyces sp. TRM68367]|uniref:hypothetical protein n=1 Tax=Streptomyces sp. TRM68367 TaxID=2758415 RepID=UPI00165BD886|nr:hypothetical protein [Streptomyces sp. TRM68367]MBC9726953.1 hypothetical protein [Streptomyces sp. TRM68367]